MEEADEASRQDLRLWAAKMAAVELNIQMAQLKLGMARDVIA